MGRWDLISDCPTKLLSHILPLDSTYHGNWDLHSQKILLLSCWDWVTYWTVHAWKLIWDPKHFHSWARRKPIDEKASINMFHISVVLDIEDKSQAEGLDFHIWNCVDPSAVWCRLSPLMGKVTSLSLYFYLLSMSDIKLWTNKSGIKVAKLVSEVFLVLIYFMLVREFFFSPSSTLEVGSDPNWTDSF